MEEKENEDGEGECGEGDREERRLGREKRWKENGYEDRDIGKGKKRVIREGKGQG